MGKLLNTTYHDTVESITGFYEGLVNNPFYLYNDKKPTIATYYNINKDYTSLDPGAKIHWDNAGEDSPIRYNVINDFLLFGFQRIELNNSNDEFGVEADNIEGECYILPNTIVPTEGDYFEVNHITDSTWLFMVNDVQKDTLDNGSNVYKIKYRVEYINHDVIMDKIVYHFRMIESKEGTNIASIVRCEDYDIAKLMDEKAVMLKSYYNEIFYNDKVQTFIFCNELGDLRLYDPMMIEFLIRNKILENNSENYIHVQHQLIMPKTISLDYNATIFRAFEVNDKIKLQRSLNHIEAEPIVSYGTTFASRFEEYYKAKYIGAISAMFGLGSCIDEDLINRIVDNKIFTEEFDNPNDIWYNIIIKYFNNEKITEDELNSIDNIEYNSSMKFFYLIPLLILCLEKSIENTLK